MGISQKLDETLNNLDLDSSAKELKERVISKSMKNLKEKMSGLDIQVERQKKAVLTLEEEKELDAYEELDDYLSLVNRTIRNLYSTQI